MDRKNRFYLAISYLLLFIISATIICINIPLSVVSSFIPEISLYQVNGSIFEGSSYLSYKYKNNTIIFSKKVNWNVNYYSFEYPLLISIDNTNILLGFNGYKIKQINSWYPLAWTHNLGSPFNSLNLQGYLYIPEHEENYSWGDKYKIPRLELLDVHTPLFNNISVGNYVIDKGIISSEINSSLIINGTYSFNNINLNINVNENISNEILPVLNMLGPVQNNKLNVNFNF